MHIFWDICCILYMAVFFIPYTVLGRISDWLNDGLMWLNKKSILAETRKYRKKQEAQKNRSKS